MSHDGLTVAVGGKEKELQLWSLATRKSVFTARNRPDDKLGLRVPVWISALSFFPDSDWRIMTATAHRQIRLNDVRAQKRPTHEWTVGERKFTAACILDENSAVVGDTVGQVTVFDFKAGRVRCKLKGCAGAITTISPHPTENSVAVSSRDRFMRVFHLQTKQGVKNKIKAKVYCKQALTCALYSSDLPVVEPKEAPKREEEDPMAWDEEISGDEKEEEMGDKAELGGEDDDEEGDEESDEESEDGEAGLAALMNGEEMDEEDDDAEQYDHSGDEEDEEDEDDEEDEEEEQPPPAKKAKVVVPAKKAKVKKAVVSKKKSAKEK